MKPWPLILLLPVVVFFEAGFTQDDPFADDEWDEDWGEETESITWSGFVEAGLGTRFSSDPLIDDRNTLEDLRWRIETEWQPEDFNVSLKADARYDGIEDEWSLDVRDLTLSLSPGSSTDLRLGRQVQTWGTGDLLFLNDLFPKDFDIKGARPEPEFAIPGKTKLI